MIKNILHMKVKQKAGVNKPTANESFFLYIGNKLPSGGIFFHL